MRWGLLLVLEMAVVVLCGLRLLLLYSRGARASSPTRGRYGSAHGRREGYLTVGI
jgi:hypothetical protein